MIYICEKCGMVYSANYHPMVCDSCGCTYMRRADEREVLEIVGSILLNGDDVLLKEDKKGVKHHK